MKNCIAVVLAGGKGCRLGPLTQDRAKPAVPFGGAYRIIDFSLSNCLNSGVSRILMLTQYKATSLSQHVNRTWSQFFRTQMGEYIEMIAPQHRLSEDWYQGTADAVYQNIYSLEKENPEYVVVLSGDHIYKMDYRPLVMFHEEHAADLTIASMPVCSTEARNFGVIQVDGKNRINGFEEKPTRPKTIPGTNDRCLASMGIYVFSTKFLFESLCKDAADFSSSNDFGRDIIPAAIHKNRVFAFPFENSQQRSAYWRDVGTLDSYYRANMDLITNPPELDLNENAWPIRTFRPDIPPAMLRSTNAEQQVVRRASVTDCIVCNGAILSGATVHRSIVGSNVRIDSGAVVEDAILFNGVHIEKNATVKRAIIDKHVTVPSGESIGHDHDKDLANGFTITDDNVVVVSRGPNSTWNRA